MVVRAVEAGAGDGIEEPVEEGFVPGVHAQGDVGLAAVAPEVALADEEAEEEAGGEGVGVGEGWRDHSGECSGGGRMFHRHVPRGTRWMFHRQVSRGTAAPSVFPGGWYHSPVARPRLLALALAVLAPLALSGCVSIANPEGWAAPVFTDSTAYVFLGGDELASLTVDDTAQPAWRFPGQTKDVRFRAVYTEPVVDGDTLYFASYDGTLFAVSAADGSLRWQQNGFVGSIVGGPVLAAGRWLVFGTTEGRLYAIDKADRTPAPGWPRDGLRLGKGVWAPPVAADGTIYAATMDGNLYAIAIDGARFLWPQPFHVGAAIPDLSLIRDGLLFVPSLDRKVYFVETESGREAFPPVRATAWVWTRPAVADSTLYFGDFAGTVFAVDITTGAVRWQADVGSKVKAAPAVVGDVLVVADRSPAVSFLDRHTGALLNRVPLQSAGTVRAPVVAHGDAAYVVTTSGKLFRATPQTLQVREVVIVGGGG